MNIESATHAEPRPLYVARVTFPGAPGKPTTRVAFPTNRLRLVFIEALAALGEADPLYFGATPYAEIDTGDYMRTRPIGAASATRVCKLLVALNGSFVE